MEIKSISLNCSTARLLSRRGENLIAEPSRENTV